MKLRYEIESNVDGTFDIISVRSTRELQLNTKHLEAAKAICQQLNLIQLQKESKSNETSI